MIGPHEGKELQLMLSGQKSLAVFHDAIPASGNIPEEVIPETAFAPYVQSKKINRHVADIRSAKDSSIIRYVCFTLPGEDWRAQFFLWLAEGRISGRIPADDACDIIAGRLLNYSESEIQHFLQKR